MKRENLNRGLASIRLHVHKSVRGIFKFIIVVKGSMTPWVGSLLNGSLEG